MAEVRRDGVDWSESNRRLPPVPSSRHLFLFTRSRPLSFLQHNEVMNLIITIDIETLFLQQTIMEDIAK